MWRSHAARGDPDPPIHVSDQGRFGTARIDAAEQGLESLGCEIPNRAIGAGLQRGLAACASVETIAPAKVLGCETGDGFRRLRFESEGVERQIAARLVVAADGARSLVRERAHRRRALGVRAGRDHRDDS